MRTPGALRSKWYFLPSLVTTTVLDAFVLISGYFLFERNAAGAVLPSYAFRTMPLAHPWGDVIGGGWPSLQQRQTVYVQEKFKVPRARMPRLRGGGSAAAVPGAFSVDELSSEVAC